MAVITKPFHFQPIPNYDLKTVKDKLKIINGDPKTSTIIVSEHVHHNRAAIEQNRQAIQDTRQEIAKVQKIVRDDVLKAQKEELAKIEETVNKVIKELNTSLVKTLGPEVVKVAKEALMKDQEVFALLLQAMSEKQREVYEERIKGLEKKIEELTTRARL